MPRWGSRARRFAAADRPRGAALATPLREAEVCSELERAAERAAA